MTFPPFDPDNLQDHDPRKQLWLVCEPHMGDAWNESHAVRETLAQFDTNLIDFSQTGDSRDARSLDIDLYLEGALRAASHLFELLNTIDVLRRVGGSHIRGVPSPLGLPENRMYHSLAEQLRESMQKPIADFQSESSRRLQPGS